MGLLHRLANLGAWPAARAPLVRGDKIYLRGAEARDYTAWATLREKSRSFLEPWEPVWSANDLTRENFRRRLQRQRDDVSAGTAYPFLIFRIHDQALVGGATLSNVRRGVVQSCSLGYWVGAAYARQGYTSDAVRALSRFVFKDLGLHRLEAACVPTNEPSKALLRKCGFTEEGYARDYLKINGIWADHVLFALLTTDKRP